jgi:hypothetical protein
MAPDERHIVTILRPDHARQFTIIGFAAQQSNAGRSLVRQTLGREVGVVSTVVGMTPRYRCAASLIMASTFSYSSVRTGRIGLF